MEAEAFRIGLIQTAHQMDRATRMVGYEISGAGGGTWPVTDLTFLDRPSALSFSTTRVLATTAASKSRKVAVGLGGQLGFGLQRFGSCWSSASCTACQRGPPLDLCGVGMTPLERYPIAE